MHRSTLFRDALPVIGQVLFWSLVIGASLAYRAVMCAWTAITVEEKVDCFNARACQDNDTVIQYVLPYYVGTQMNM